MTMKMEQHLDESVRPQDDFFTYANSNWLNDNPMPDTESRWGTFHVLREEALENMRNIYEGLQSKKDINSIEKQARDFYYTGINFDKFEERHWSVLGEIMSTITATDGPSSLSNVIGQLHRRGANVPWALYVGTDENDATKYVAHLYQGGLSLPDRDYYLSSDKEMVKARDKYKDFLGNAYDLYSDIAASKEKFVDTIFSFEHKIAKIQRTNSQLRDVEANYHPISFEDLQNTYANIDWQEYANGANLSYTKNISHDQPEFMEFINKSFVDLPVEDWHIYLKWQLLRQYLPVISKKTAKIYFEFFGKVINGTKKDQPHWKKVVYCMDHAMGENVGQLYVGEHFPEASKKAVLQMVDEISNTFAGRIEDLDWMGDATKAYAIKKLRNMKVLIGYPDKWRDFTSLRVARDSFVENLLEAEMFNHDFELSRLGQPNSRDQWYMSPQTVNAYHDPSRLVICFPAGILQAPFFDREYSMAQNFGGIGMVIGHELTHAFDDQGSQFDADGNVRSWQTVSEKKSFAKPCT
ncbi:M13 family metallopeptidase [Candidatus Saccharibacteria bacterium]|nr:M13 family metallopeptidase [Candidatus Saccharibacteria bacterium]